MIPEKMLQVLRHEGVVAMATGGEEGPHLINTWHSYVQVTEDDRLLFPAGRMQQTEANIKTNNRVLITMGSREVEGINGPGVGFLIRGVAAFLYSGPHFEVIKQRFPWVRAAVEVTITSVTQTL